MFEKQNNIRLEGDVPSARDPPSGCPFHIRCPEYIGEICEKEHPDLNRVDSSDDATHFIACHYDIDDLADEL